VEFKDLKEILEYGSGERKEKVWFS
jgi:hypothetical protein